MLVRLGENVRRFRAAAGLSQVALADRARISRRTVIKLESGTANISLTGLEQLADALGVRSIDLLSESPARRTQKLLVHQPAEGNVLIVSEEDVRQASRWARPASSPARSKLRGEQGRPDQGSRYGARTLPDP